ncbi:MAG TPA: ZIP family metal transporter [Polyangiaceae bacterium]
MSWLAGRWVPVAFAVATFFSTAAGGWVALRRRSHLDAVMGAAAGLLVGAALFDLLPDAIEIGGPARFRVMVATAVGFGAFFAAERLVHLGASRHQEEGRERTFGAGAALGLTVHSLLDGVAIGGAFHADARIGVLVGVAVVAHDFGDGVSTVGVVLGSRGATRSSIAWLLADAIAPVVGALLALDLEVPRAALAAMLAFFAGSFLFLGAGHLLPEAARPGSRGRVSALFLACVAVTAVATWLSRR